MLPYNIESDNSRSHKFEPYNFGPNHFGSPHFGPPHFAPPHFAPPHFAPHNFGPPQFGPHNFEKNKNESFMGHHYGPPNFGHHKCPFNKNPNNCPGKSWNCFPWGPVPISKEENVLNMNLNVQHFKPGEVSVKVVDDFVVVDGKHDERGDDHGFITRSFTRRYRVPKNVDPNTITSKLSVDGLLSITAPKKIDENNKEKEIPVVFTNEPAMKPALVKKDDIEKLDFALNNYEI